MDNNANKGFLKRFPILGNLLIIIGITVALIVIAMIMLSFWTHHGETSTVPDIKGMTLTQAQNVLSDADLEYVISDSIYDDSKAGGTVVEVWPKPGAVVKAGREVYLTIVSFTPRMVVIDMPLTDISLKQAQNYLSSHGISSINVVYVPSDFPQMVLSAKSNGEYVTLGSRIPASSTVTLEVGKTPEPTLDDFIDEQVDSIVSEPDNSYFD